MGAVRITQIDGTLPNLALMRLAASHRERGDEVVFSRSVRRGMFEPAYDHVYGSAIFKFSADRIARFQQEFPDAVIGGTGSGSAVTVESVIGNGTVLDYILAPQALHGMG